MRRGYISLKCSLILAALLVVALAGSVWCVRMIHLSLVGAARAELRGVVKMWVAEGRPEGEELQAFMAKLPSDVFPTNREFDIGGDHIHARFAIRGFGMGKTLYISTNDIAIIEGPSTRARIYRDIQRE